MKLCVSCSGGSAALSGAAHARQKGAENMLNDAVRGIGLPKPERVVDVLAMPPMLYSF